MLRPKAWLWSKEVKRSPNTVISMGRSKKKVFEKKERNEVGSTAKKQICKVYGILVINLF